jgi:hypothetical protein
MRSPLSAWAPPHQPITPRHAPLSLHIFSLSDAPRRIDPFRHRRRLPPRPLPLHATPHRRRTHPRRRRHARRRRRRHCCRRRRRMGPCVLRRDAGNRDAPRRVAGPARAPPGGLRARRRGGGGGVPAVSGRSGGGVSAARRGRDLRPRPGPRPPERERDTQPPPLRNPPARSPALPPPSEVALHSPSR